MSPFSPFVIEVCICLLGSGLLLAELTRRPEGEPWVALRAWPR